MISADSLLIPKKLGRVSGAAHFLYAMSTLLIFDLINSLPFAMACGVRILFVLKNPFQITNYQVYAWIQVFISCIKG